MAATGREDRMKELTDRLQAGLDELFESEKYARYLKVMSQFHHYSFNNTLLIALQRPDATLVAGYRAWETKFNRHVRRDEKGIQIIAPAPFRTTRRREKTDPETGLTVLGRDGQPETEEVTLVLPRFRVSVVYDLAQTEGEPLPELGAGELHADVENYGTFLRAISAVAPVPIRFAAIEGEAKGYYDNGAKEIVIREGMSEMQTMKTAVHETAHALLHDRDFLKRQGLEKDRMTREVEAESVAFVSLAHFALDTSDYSFPYIAAWSSGREAKELKTSLNTIRETAAEIIDGIEAELRLQQLDRQKAEERTEGGFVRNYYVVEDLNVRGPLSIREFADARDALEAYFALPNSQTRALGIRNTAAMPGSLDFLQCVNGIDRSVDDWKAVEGWDNAEIRSAAAGLEQALTGRDTELAYVLPEGFVTLEGGGNGWTYSFYDANLVCTARGSLNAGAPGEPAYGAEAAVREIGERLGSGFAEWTVTDYPELLFRIQTLETERLREAARPDPDSPRPAPVEQEQVRFFAAENMKYPVMGEYFETESLAEALRMYGENPEGRLQGVGMHLENGSLPILERGKGVTDVQELPEEAADNPLVRQALAETKRTLAETQDRLAETGRAGEPAVQVPESEQPAASRRGGRSGEGRKSAVKALREHRSEIERIEKEKETPARRSRSRKKGETVR